MTSERRFFLTTSLIVGALALYFLALSSCGGVMFEATLISYCRDCCIGSYGIRQHPGYDAPFADSQFVGAKFANGARVVGDFGDQGTVLGSIWIPTLGVAYFVAWERHPKQPILTIESRFTAAP
jgi:hypothetical protein